MSSFTLKQDLQDGVLTLAWARPSCKNAFNLALYGELAAALSSAQANPDVRVLVLFGEGGVFSSGNDLQEFLTWGDDMPQALLAFMVALRDCTKPVGAAINGPAVGIGATLLLHCDYRVASPQASLIFPFTKLGLCPEFAASLLLPKLVGLARAQTWLLMGEPVLAEEALRAGFLQQVDGEPLNQVHAWARQLARYHPQALEASKNLLRAPWMAEVAMAM